MRKQVLFGAALLALGTAVVSCSKDEVVIDNTPGVETPVAEGEQEIVLQVANTGDELTSRAGRPLYSAEAKQNIDNVFIMIVDNDGTVVKTNQINDWMNVSEDYATNGHGKEYTWKIPAAEALGEGTYKVYAIGYSNSSDYIYGTNQTIAHYVDKMEGSSASFEKFVATLESIAAEEFFAGEIEQIEVDGNGEFKLEANNPNANVLTLHRQVTGVTGYFINVPTSAANNRGKIMAALSESAANKDKNRDAYNQAIASYKLRLVASNCNDQIVAAGFNSEFTTTGENVKYIVNGLQSGGFNITAGANFSGESDNLRYIVYEISLGDWFPNGDVNNDGILGEADANAGVNNWGKPSTMGDQSVGFQPGSVFGSSFLIPFLKKAGTKTLELQLWGKPVSVTGTGEADYIISGGIGSEEILRSWNINLASDDDQLGSTSVNGNFVWTLGKPDDYEPVRIEDATMAEERTSYSLVRNHLYSVGEKGTDEWDPDTDEPEDLSKGQNLILRVNDNWELIHKMEVE